MLCWAIHRKTHSVTESGLESMRINVVESEEGGATEKPGGPLSQNARP